MKTTTKLLITVSAILCITQAHATENKQMTQLSIVKLYENFAITSSMPNPKKEKNGDLKIFCTNIVFHKWAEFYLNVLKKTPVSVDDIGVDTADKFASYYFKFEYKTKQLEFFRPGVTTTITEAINGKIFELNNNKILAEDQFRYDEINEELYKKTLDACICNDLYQKLTIPKAPDATVKLPGHLYTPTFTIDWHATKEGGLEPLMKIEASLESLDVPNMNYKKFIRTLMGERQ
jgi:hypothetical protein